MSCGRRGLSLRSRLNNFSYRCSEAEPVENITTNIKRVKHAASDNVTHTSALPYCLRDQRPPSVDLARLGRRTVQISRRHHPQSQRRAYRDQRNVRPRAHSRQARTGRGIVRFYAGTKGWIVEMGASNSSAEVWLATTLRCILRERIGGGHRSQVYSKPEATSSESVV